LDHFPKATFKNAQCLSKKLIKSVDDLKILHLKSLNKIVTVSGDIGWFNPENKRTESWEDAIQLADCGLYKAKRSGRNQIATIRNKKRDQTKPKKKPRSK